MTCPICGGTLHGDGNSTVVHCENTDADTWSVEPDAGPIYCDYEPCDEKDNNMTPIKYCTERRT